jgi:hypothetical protein
MDFNQKHKDSQSNKTFFLTFLCPGKLLIKKGWGRGKGEGGEGIRGGGRRRRRVVSRVKQKGSSSGGGGGGGGGGG